MGLLALGRLMSMQRDRQIQARKGSTTSVAKRKDDNSRSYRKLRYLGQSLPEDIWWYIHSLMRLGDAARAACVSRSFRRSWKCYPNLKITSESLGLKGRKYTRSFKVSSALARKTDLILKNHSGNGVKALRLQINDFPVFSTSSDLDRWLRIAVRPGIEELDLRLSLHSRQADVYNFPCLLPLDGIGKSIRHLHLSNCAFRPTSGLGCLTSLTSLEFSDVHITGDELGHLLSSSVALEKMKLVYCHELISLRIPILLQRLGHLFVHDCEKLEVIESKAPNLYSFRYMGGLVRLSLGDSLRDFEISTSGRAGSCVEQELVLGDSSHDLRKVHLHGNIKDVQIIGLCSAKSIVELTCHILENAKSLECLTLSTFYNGEILCSGRKKGKCVRLSRDMITEAHKTLLVVQRYIVGNVPSSVKLKVVEPCSRCNALEI